MSASRRLPHPSLTASHPMVDNTRPLDLANGQHGPATGWRVHMRNDSPDTSYAFKVMVVCAG